MEVSEQIKQNWLSFEIIFYFLDNNIQESELGNQSPSTSSQRKFICSLSESKVGGSYLF